jgi:ABC-type lipoprotein export system ATPase subunit
MLAEVDLAGKANRYPSALSGGEQQRVAVARALVHGPALVLADEPTASLDSANGAALLDLMARMRHRSGTAFLIASHDPRLLARMDRIVELEDGRLASPRPARALVG